MEMEATLRLLLADPLQRMEMKATLRLLADPWKEWKWKLPLDYYWRIPGKNGNGSYP